MATHGPFIHLLTPQGRKTTAEPRALSPLHISRCRPGCACLSQEQIHQVLLTAGACWLLQPVSSVLRGTWECLSLRESLVRVSLYFSPVCSKIHPTSTAFLAQACPLWESEAALGGGSGLSQEKLSFGLILYLSWYFVSMRGVGSHLPV